ncbi:MAG: addiction module protein [Planctomycetes bacterium]|nr:addiction module protein [Planctomycetota bacterium]
MTATAKSLLESALTLPQEERRAIAEALLESVPDDISELDEEAFAAELRRRSDEMKKDPSCGIPWSELRKMR